MHTYMHSHIQTNIHTYIQANKHTYMHAYIHTYIQAYILTYMHQRAYIHACMDVCWRMFIYVHVFKRSSTFRYIHAICKDTNAIIIDHQNQRHTYKIDSMSDSKMQFDNYSDNTMPDRTLLDICVADVFSADISYQSTNRLLSISPISIFDVSQVSPNVNGWFFRQ